MKIDVLFGSITLIPIVEELLQLDYVSFKVFGSLLVCRSLHRQLSSIRVGTVYRVPEFTSASYHSHNQKHYSEGWLAFGVRTDSADLFNILLPCSKVLLHRLDILDALLCEIPQTLELTRQVMLCLFKRLQNSLDLKTPRSIESSKRALVLCQCCYSPVRLLHKCTACTCTPYPFSFPLARTQHVQGLSSGRDWREEIRTYCRLSCPFFLDRLGNEIL